MVKKQNNITLNMDLGKMTGSGQTFARRNLSGSNRKKELFEEAYLEENKKLPEKGAVYNASAEVDNIPQFGDFTLKIPPFFAVQSKTGWRLANPLTEMRNLANRQNELSVNIKRANVTEPELEMEEPEVTPEFDDFSPKDQAKLVAYFQAVKQGKEDEYLFKNKPRGFPAVLYKNAKKAGLKETKEKVYTKNAIKKQPKNPKGNKGPKQVEIMLQEDADEEARLLEEARAFAARARARMKAKSTGGKIVPVPPTPPPPPPTTAVVPPNIAPPPETTEERDRRMRQEGNARLRKRLVRGGRLPINLNPLDIIPQGLKAVKDKVVDIAQKVVKGRDGYSPSVTAIIEKFADQEVKSIELHRRVLPTVYTGLLNVLTLGEFNKRIKDQPKDKLFHISMWVKLANGKTVLVEKNEVINMKVNPKKEKEEEVQPAGAVPSVFTFGEMLDKTQKEMGGKYFTYSARDNNCGNYIEAVLKANGMNTKETNDFIGQDAKAILKGYPRIAKALNAITDIAGRANVVMEGGGMYESDCDCESECECECDDKEMNGEGLMLGRGFHVATMSNRFHRIPQSESQIKSYFQGSGLLDKIGKTLDPKRNGIVKLANKTFTPKTGTKIASALIHEGVPAVVGGVSGAATTAVTGNPALGIAVGAVAKKYAGKKAEDELSKTTGYGMKKPKFAKGSQEAKDYMKMLRDKRGKK